MQKVSCDTDMCRFSCAFWLLHGSQGQFAGSGLMGGAYWPFSMQWGVGGGAGGAQRPRKDIHQNPKRKRSSPHSHVLVLCQAPVSGELALSLRSCLFYMELELELQRLGVWRSPVPFPREVGFLEAKRLA